MSCVTAFYYRTLLMTESIQICLYWLGLNSGTTLHVYVEDAQFKCISQRSRNTNEMQLCNRIYYSKVYWRLNMFRAARRSSSGALNYICNLWFICPCGDRPLSRLSGKWMIHLPHSLGRFLLSLYTQEHSHVLLCSYVSCKYLWKGSECEGSKWQWKIHWVGFVQDAVRKMQYTARKQLCQWTLLLYRACCISIYAVAICPCSPWKNPLFRPKISVWEDFLNLWKCTDFYC